MMEILHKAKRLDNGKWIEGYYAKIIVVFSKKEHHYISTCEVPFLVEIDPETVCVCTGKNDEKGKKIWEHDYVAFIDMSSTESGYSEYQCAGEVVWDEETASFQVTNRLSAESYEVLDECTVIGNSFDNPDMLEDY